MSLFIFLCLLQISTIFSHSYSVKDIEKHEFHPDTGLNISQLLERHGYPFELHTVQTEDGYLLGLHRVPYGVQNTNNTNNKPVALLVHGLMSQSADWVNNEPDNSLGLILADQGYDVWLLNTRGNTNSRKHTTLDPDVDKSEFWDFSWHECGVYDLPATIDYILNETGQEKLFYFGHSRGTTVFFVMASMLPEYNEKIRLMSALAPVAFMNNSVNPSEKILAKNLQVLKVFVKAFNIHELLPHSNMYLKLVETCCYEESPCYTECEEFVKFEFGNPPTEFNMTLLPVHATNSPAGISVKDVLHYLQQFHNNARFMQYDHGRIGNLRKYKQMEPPEYNLNNIIAPVALHYSVNDQTTNYIDVEYLASILPNLVQTRRVPQYFNHLDFIWGNHARTLVYNAILEDLTRF